MRQCGLLVVIAAQLFNQFGTHLLFGNVFVFGIVIGVLLVVFLEFLQLFRHFFVYEFVQLGIGHRAQVFADKLLQGKQTQGILARGIEQTQVNLPHAFAIGLFHLYGQTQPTLKQFRANRSPILPLQRRHFFPRQPLHRLGTLLRHHRRDFGQQGCFRQIRRHIGL